MAPQYFIGPMSKNVVDAAIEFCNKTGNILGFIPSRRQIDWDYGYVNHWRTNTFAKYISKNTDKILTQRDHSGPGQGTYGDDGIISLVNDAKYLDLIHIDPWKQHPNYEDGLAKTISLITMCHAVNPNVQFEIGTEEAIRRFEVEELDNLVSDLISSLDTKIFNQIKYLVIQSGTSLKGNNQTGTYDATRLIEMLKIGKKYGLLTKEHNGDYIPVSTIKEKFSLGLDAINIAPEFGLIETQTYLDNIKDDVIFNKYWEICYYSNKWVKWVNEDFDPINNKTELIKICGHYVLSYPNFLSGVKSYFPNIDTEIKLNIKNKLNELYK
jgi:hypothetical protein